MTFRHASLTAAATVATLLTLAGCSSDNATPNATGGSTSAGGAASGGKSASGGQASGGLTGSGGQAAGGQTGSGGSAAGGTSSGGTSTGGQASGGGNGGGATLPATFDTFKDVVLEKCGGQGCHNDPQNPLQMKFTDSNLYKIVTTHKVAKCSNMLAISPGKPAESAILKVVVGGCGSISRMPPSCLDDTDASCVTPDYVSAITQWVMNGAPEK